MVWWEWKLIWKRQTHKFSCNWSKGYLFRIENHACSKHNLQGLTSKRLTIQRNTVDLSHLAQSIYYVNIPWKSWIWNCALTSSDHESQKYFKGAINSFKIRFLHVELYSWYVTGNIFNRSTRLFCWDDF